MTCFSIANPSAKTFGENQMVIHYAAKYNAVPTLKILIEHRVDYNVKDYKGRTPLFLSAEMGKLTFHFSVCWNTKEGYKTHTHAHEHAHDIKDFGSYWIRRVK